MGVQFTRSGAQRIMHGVRTIEGLSPQVTAPPKNPRHPRRKTNSASGSIIQFEFDNEEDPYEEEESNECSADNESVELTQRVKVVYRPCGSTRVAGEDEEGYVEVTDTMGCWLDGRTAQEVRGKVGMATLFQDDYEGCFWAITNICWFTEIQVVTDTIVGDKRITIERKNVEVWKECDLPDEVIEGVDCEDDEYY